KPRRPCCPGPPEQSAAGFDQRSVEARRFLSLPCSTKAARALRAEKPLDLDSGRLRAVGGMYHVVGVLQCEVSPNRTGCSLQRVRSTNKIAHVGYGVGAFKDCHDHGPRRNRRQQPGKKGLVGMVTVMHPRYILADAVHLDAYDPQDLLFKALQNLADEPAGYGLALTDDKGLLHILHPLSSLQKAGLACAPPYAPRRCSAHTRP